MNAKRSSKPTFQEIILKLHAFFASRGCVIWNPHHGMVGAGTFNTATLFRVLGPEPWNVAYVEPSFRPDDGRFAENPNRMQMHHQYQVILKPAPIDSQQLYLDSLAEIGLRREEHDIRFVEDNWEAPPLSAWGLGWEVWLDGMEITQFTYFQQAGGMPLDPPSCELTYGLERIAMYLQDVNSVWDLTWDGKISYGEILKQQEIEYCEYEFNDADIERLRTMYDLFEAEAKKSIASKLVTPAYDFVCQCSHTFNVLDARGAIALSERVKYFGRMRELVKQVTELYFKRREELGFPLLQHEEKITPPKPASPATSAKTPQTFALELGVEELAAFVPPLLIAQIKEQLPKLLAGARLSHGDIYVSGTPRRIAVTVEKLLARQEDSVKAVRGPAREAAQKNPQALAGFCRKNGITPEQVKYEKEGAVEYAVARVEVPGRSAGEVLAEVIPALLAALKVDSTMRWLGSSQYGDAAKISFNRPIRWIVALFGDEIVPLVYAGLVAGNTSRAGRWENSKEISVRSAKQYLETLAKHDIEVDAVQRRDAIKAQVEKVVSEVKGTPRVRPAVLDEVSQLVEYPTAFLCRFEDRFLELPAEVIVSTMEKHVRCFAVFDAKGGILPYFVGVRNGGSEHIDVVRRGYERLIAARFSDAAFFVGRDRQHKLEDFVERTKKLMFHAKIGSMYDKSERLGKLTDALVEGPLPVKLDRAALKRAARLAKADLASQMVTEMTSLQGEMGRIYALQSGENEKVAVALFEQYLPRAAGDRVPASPEGLVLSIADRLDTLAALFSVGVEPTGSADPFGLRREALAVITCLIQTKTRTSLRAGLEQALKLLPSAPAGTAERVLEFVRKRLEVVLREEGFRHDVVRAVLARFHEDPYTCHELVSELNALVMTRDARAAEGFKLSTQAVLRCQRIVDAAEQKGIAVPAAVNQTLLVEGEEKELAQALAKVNGASHGEPPSFRPVYDQIERLVRPITAFFDKVMVMAEDAGVRGNRLALVNRVAALVAPYADLRELEGFKE